MENNIFDYHRIKDQLCNKNYLWDEILEEYEKLHNHSEFELTFITGLYGNNESPSVRFYNICGSGIVEWHYCFESRKIIVELHRVLDITNIVLELKNYNETELKFKIKDKDISFNNFDTNSGISVKLKDIIIKIYKEFINQL